jgi:predicted small secreted protein
MGDFLHDTLDPIERKYGKIIVVNFPNYAIFWNKYVGVRLDGNMIRPYKLIYDRTIGVNEKKVIRNNFNLINMYHYSIFTNLVGSYIQYDDIVASKYMKSVDVMHTRHWDAFETFYIKLGNVLNINAALWSLILELNGKYNSSFNKSFQQYLISNRKKNIWSEYIRFNNIVKIIRNDVVHFSRIAGSYIQGIGFFTPYRKRYPSKPIGQDRPKKTWAEQIRSKEFMQTDYKVKRDLSNCEKLLDKMYTLLIVELDLYITNSKIKVNII